MGSLVTETPLSEIMATMEVLERLGVNRNDLKHFRKASRRIQTDVLKNFKGGGRVVIDCDAPPKDLWSSGKKLDMPYHQRQGRFDWDDGKNVVLVKYPERLRTLVRPTLSDVLEAVNEIWGTEICLNANVHDFLIEKPYLIPWEWKGRTILFLGSVFECDGYGGEGRILIRCLEDHARVSEEYRAWRDQEHTINAFYRPGTYVALRAK